MTVTSGFFNSVNHDRKYNAEEISSIFDGIILDGVYQGFGEAFKVEGTSTANQVKIGTGRAWFNHTWTLNDEALYLTLPAPNSTYPRIDAIVLEVNNSSSVRANTIKYISGSAASSPTKPTLTNTTDVHQYPLAYITRPKATTTISAGNIENAIGTSACPIVTGVLEVLSDDRFIAQTVANLTTDFNTWFEGIKDLLNENVAANLANKINENAAKIEANSKYIKNLSLFVKDPNNGIFLGSSISDTQYESIKNGTFYNMNIGDYWEVNDKKIYIVGFNYFKNEPNDGSLTPCDKNHVVLCVNDLDKTVNLEWPFASYANKNPNFEASGVSVLSRWSPSNGSYSQNIYLNDSRYRVPSEEITSIMLSTFGDKILEVPQAKQIDPFSYEWYNTKFLVPNYGMFNTFKYKVYNAPVSGLDYRGDYSCSYFYQRSSDITTDSTLSNYSVINIKPQGIYYEGNVKDDLTGTSGSTKGYWVDGVFITGYRGISDGYTKIYKKRFCNNNKLTPIGTVKFIDTLGYSMDYESATNSSPKYDIDDDCTIGIPYDYTYSYGNYNPDYKAYRTRNWYDDNFYTMYKTWSITSPKSLLASNDSNNNLFYWDKNTQYTSEIYNNTYYGIGFFFDRLPSSASSCFNSRSKTDKTFMIYDENGNPIPYAESGASNTRYVGTTKIDNDNVFYRGSVAKFSYDFEYSMIFCIG